METIHPEEVATVNVIGLNGVSSKKRKLTYRNEHELKGPVTTTYIDEAFKNLKQYCNCLVNKTSEECETNAFDIMIKTLSEASSLEALLNSCNDLQLVFSDNATLQGIKCTACFNEYENAGLFKFSNPNEVHSLGKANQPILSAKFKGLRCIIRHHLLSNNHGQNVSRQHRDLEKSVATMSDVENKIEDMKAFLKELLCIPTPNSVLPTRKPKSLVAKSTSISEILEACSHLSLLLGPVATDDLTHFNAIACLPCRSSVLRKIPDSKSKVGLFPYHHTVGTNFGGHKKNEQLQPLVFWQLKDKLSGHLSTKFHCNAVGIPYIPNEKEAELLSKNETAGIILGKLAYKAIVKYQSKSSFEDEVTFLSDIGVEIGDLNHSVDYVNNLFPHLYAVLKERTMTVLHEPVSMYLQASPFVVFADKITPYGTTLQIIGIIIFKDGKNTPITLDVVPVKHKIQNGAALAEDIVNTLYKFFTPESAKKMYVGCSFDGQYIALKVPQEILRLLGFAVNITTPLKELNQQLFHSYSWDPAHLLELACGDVKKTKLHEWVDKTETTIVTINRGNTYGKPYLRLLEEAQQLDLVLMRPGSFSETRFSTYKHRVLNRFLNNYPVLYTTHSKDQDSDLNLFNNVEFCVRLSGLVDIFHLIGDTSVQIQSSELLPWECDDIINNCIQKLENMSRHLSPTVSSSDWKALSEAVEEITKRETFKEKPILIQKTTFYATRSNSIIITRDTSFAVVIQRVLSELQFYVRELAKAMQKRYSKHHTQKTFVMARDSFSRSLILERNETDIPQSFQEYCNLARTWGFLDTSVSQTELNYQYSMFCSKVQTGYNTRLHTFGLHIPECMQYWEIMNSDDERESMSHVLNLLLTSLVRNKSECIAESIGSMMKQHLDQRCSLSDKNLGMEIFLHFNGPRPNRDCNGLVRKANKRLFGKNSMHFYRTSHLSDLKFWEDGSKVITKVHSKSGRIDVPDED